MRCTDQAITYVLCLVTLFVCTILITTTAEMCPLNYGGTGDGCQPPNLITTLINIALAPGTVEEPMYKGQAGLQVLHCKIFKRV
jgi:hypothetical protein